MDADIFSLDSYVYDLPEDRIAQRPPDVRGASRLMVLDRRLAALRGTPEGKGWLTDAVFGDLPAFLPPGALLVANNSRVVPARLLGKRPSGGRVELLLLTPPPLVEKAAEALAGDGRNRGECGAEAEVLLKPGRSVHVGDRLEFGPVSAEVLSKGEFGRHGVRLFWKGELSAALEEVGRLPLPPYIKREQGPEDRARYQTLYARPDKAGSVAAPTAGLHFTEEMRARLEREGFGWVEATLHVGYGTFSPVREADIRRHLMHGEYVEVPPATAAMVNAARAEGRPVVAVGTTSARILEGTARATGGGSAGPLPAEGWSGWTDIFIYPGYEFQVVDGLITNFHLPGSSLLMLASAIAGREELLAAYAEAVSRKYRFFSYGDAMLIR